MRERNQHRQTAGEEIANSVSHGIGLVAALTCLPYLILASVHRGAAGSIIGACVFAVTVILLYLSSTVYHALPESEMKRKFRLLDHGAVFLLIAGTYTPFTLGVLWGIWGWLLLGAVWGLAALGIGLKIFRGVRHPILSTGLYLGMGWLAILVLRPFTQHVPMAGVAWLAAGGVAYTVGVAFFASDRVRYFHFVWHLFVLAGTAFHFVAVLNYAG